MKRKHQEISIAKMDGAVKEDGNFTTTKRAIVLMESILRLPAMVFLVA